MPGRTSQVLGLADNRKMSRSHEKSIGIGLNLARNLVVILAATVLEAHAQVQVPAWADDANADWKLALVGQMPYPESPGDTANIPDGYEVISVVGMFRHGSRYATGSHETSQTYARWFDDVTQQGTLTADGLRLRDAVLEFAASWDPVLTGSITALGRLELIGIARRTAHVFSSQGAENTQLLTAYSGAKRALQSRDAYVEGIEAVLSPDIVHRGQEAFRMVDPHNPVRGGHPEYIGVHREWIYRFTDPVFDAYLKSPPVEVIMLAEQFVTGLGEAEAGELIFTLYQTCGQDIVLPDPAGICDPIQTALNGPHETAIHAWLSEPTEQRMFYHVGPAMVNGGIHLEFGQAMMREFLDFTEEAIGEPDGSYRINAMFGHDAGVAMLLAQLNLVIDEGLDAVRWASWKDYGLIPMGGNVQWQVLRHRANDSDIKVRLLVHERETPFPIEGCGHERACDWSRVQQHYRDRLAAQQAESDTRLDWRSTNHD